MPFRSRWIQPGQQHGRRLPSASSVCARETRRARVSMSFADSTQHIHSFRASGVMSCHAASDSVSTRRALRRSRGIVCTVPAGMFACVMMNSIAHARGRSRIAER